MGPETHRRRPLSPGAAVPVGRLRVAAQTSRSPAPSTLLPTVPSDAALVARPILLSFRLDRGRSRPSSRLAHPPRARSFTRRAGTPGPRFDPPTSHPRPPISPAQPSTSRHDGQAQVRRRRSPDGPHVRHVSVPLIPSLPASSLSRALLAPPRSLATSGADGTASPPLPSKRGRLGRHVGRRLPQVLLGHDRAAVVSPSGRRCRGTDADQSSLPVLPSRAPSSAPPGSCLSSVPLPSP